MLQQETISAIALCVSLTGIVMLFAFAESLEARQVQIGEIDEALLGWHVKINAKILSSYQLDSTVFLQLYDGTGKIKAVLFKPSKQQQELIGKNTFASFEGKVQLYKNELEIIVEQVKEWA